MSKPWLYFGCGPGETGHFLCAEGGQRLHAFGSHPHAWLREMCWDGNLAPHPEPAADSAIYRAALSRLGGWGYSALSWWDRSADNRRKSNSNILAPHLNIDPVIMLDEAKQRFPWVFSRLPQPLVLIQHPAAHSPDIIEGTSHE